MNTRHAVGSIAAVVAIGAALIGCGTSGTSHTAGPSSTATTTAQSVTPTPTPTVDPTTRCHTADLSATAQVTSSAGRTNMLAVILTNTGSRPCTAYGFPGLEFTGVPAVTIDRASAAPLLVLLAPRVEAEFLVTVTHPDTVRDATTCPQPSGLRIIPPDETSQLTVASSPQGGGADAMHVCAGDRMTVRALTSPAVTWVGSALPEGMPDCRPKDLAATAFHSANGDGMGHVGVQVWVANTSGADCVIRGALNVVPDNGSGTAQPAQCAGTCTPAPDTVLALPAGAVIVANGSTTNGAGNESACGTETPFDAKTIRVFLPDGHGVVTGPYGAALYCHGAFGLNDFQPL
ncbi:DUF4232 domain-containing protein [Nocardia sp. NPDC020380]|uniref:DUF4232 domain-containing protein n=1 Tax=Nocardia sp. NPDC020380 TaxID=3364309 RepID=UPI00378AFAA4